LRDTQLSQKQKPRYDGHCRELTVDDPLRPHVIRFKNPAEGIVSFKDFVRGEITVDNRELDDLILIRTDGVPTYNFTVVVDDLDMKISHVIRGDDHINNTPRQINIMRALGQEPPEFGHVPMILGSDGKRLSKRHGAVSVLQYREEGYLPQALINYLVRLGWSYQDQEIFTRDEMINLFNPENIQRAAAAFDPNKLTWINQQYLKSLDPSLVAHELARQLQQHVISIDHGPPLEEIVKAQAERCKTLQEMAIRSNYFFSKIEKYDEKASGKFFTAENLPMMTLVKDKLHELENWQKDEIHSLITEIASEQNWSLGQIAQPIRLAITGGTVSPPIDVTLWLLGKQQTCLRLEDAIGWIHQNHPISAT
jgi:glutamyl-tRNA synthetase